MKFGELSGRQLHDLGLVMGLCERSESHENAREEMEVVNTGSTIPLCWRAFQLIHAPPPWHSGTGPPILQLEAADDDRTRRMRSDSCLQATVIANTALV
jgi:hypothetical protein